MDFQEALTLLQAGEVLHREAWPIAEGYLSFMKGMKHVWKIVLEPNPNAGNFIFSVEDFLAHDWKLFEVPAPAIDVPVAEVV